MKYRFFLLCQIFFFGTNAQMSSHVLLEKTIQHHDPKGNWANFRQRLFFKTSMPNRADTNSVVELDNRRRYFNFIARDGARTVEKGFLDGEFFALIDGKNVKNADDARRFRLRREQIRETRDFFNYVLGLPMKLTDNGARLSPKVERTTFDGAESLVLRVSYDPSVGDDVWLFYINPTSFALRGCRFLRGGKTNEGAFIVFDGEFVVQNVRLPKTRRWFWNGDNRFLASETIESSSSFAAGLARRR